MMMLTVRSDVTGLQVCPGRVDALGRITHGVDRRYRSDGRLGLQWWHRRGAPVRHVRSLNARTRRKRYASDGACRCGVRGASGAHTARRKANLPYVHSCCWAWHARAVREHRGGIRSQHVERQRGCPQVRPAHTTPIPASTQRRGHFESFPFWGRRRGRVSNSLQTRRTAATDAWVGCVTLPP